LLTLITHEPNSQILNYAGLLAIGVISARISLTKKMNIPHILGYSLNTYQVLQFSAVLSLIAKSAIQHNQSSKAQKIDKFGFAA
jgi:hypothetical protein